MAKPKRIHLGHREYSLRSHGLFVAAFAVAGFSLLTISSAAGGQVNLKSYYPNFDQTQNNYLEGFNHKNNEPLRSVLWFEQLNEQTFRAYNSEPENPNSRCYWDELSWQEEGALRHSKMHDSCPGSTPSETIYDTPITLLPQKWKKSSGAWLYEGSTGVSYYESGQLRCIGTNNYVSEIVGEEEIAPGKTSIHWRTTQTITWEAGDTDGKCFKDPTMNLQEDRWLSTLPKPGGKEAKGLKRTKEGNLDTNQSKRDIWFDKWERLPR